MMFNSKKTSFIIIALIMLVAVFAGVTVQQKQLDNSAKFSKLILLDKPKTISADIAFKGHNGKHFGAEQLQNKWSILFFGFTNCPDICPTTMQTLKQVKAQLVEQQLWNDYQVVMVSVDPQRDTTEVLADYVPYFDPEFIGINGDLAMTTEFAKQLGILFFASESEDNNYSVDHSASLVLINPEGQMAGVITAPHTKDEISGDLAALAGRKAIFNTRLANKQAHKQSAQPIVVSDKTIKGLSLQQAWIRPAPKNAKSMAGYFVLRNDSSQEIVISEVKSPQFSMTMFHDTVIKQGMASMQRLSELRIPANSQVALTPAGKHLMLMNPAKPLKIGDIASIQLITNDGASLQQQITVRQPAN